MKCEIKNTSGKKVGDIELNDSIFGLDPRADILDRVVQWQMARKQSGNHQTKGTSDVNATGKKCVRQKGSGGARHSSRKVNIFRGGGVVFGPVTRDHSYGLQKKVRKLGLKMAFSAKAKENNLTIVDGFDFKDYSTKTAKAAISAIAPDAKSVLVIDIAKPSQQVQKSFDNIIGLDALPECGANVYDILKKDIIILTTAAAKRLEERLA